MAIIEKKIWPGNFGKVASGEKTYEPRLGDFVIKEGDTLLLREWDPKKEKYTGREVRKKVKSVLKLSPSELRKYWSLDDIEKHGLQIISIE